MHGYRKAGLAALLVAGGLGGTAMAEGGMLEDFSGTGGTKWAFFTDQVMGGVSEGRARIEEVDGERALRLTGTVSTENRGGFIQARLDLDAPLAPDAEGIVLRVRGDGQRYFVHLRTSGTRLPWQYYQAPFETEADWTEVRLPWTAFEPSGRMLRDVPKPETLRSVALVAYGRDHEADVSLAEIGAYRSGGRSQEEQ